MVIRDNVDESVHYYYRVRVGRGLAMVIDATAGNTARFRCVHEYEFAAMDGAYYSEGNKYVWFAIVFRATHIIYVPE